jgi:hypothetical protein
LAVRARGGTGVAPDMGRRTVTYRVSRSMVRWRVQSVAALFTGSERPLVVDGDSARIRSLRGSARSHFGVRRERGHGGVEWCGADKPGEAVVADPNSPVVAALRHRELDNWL